MIVPLSVTSQSGKSAKAVLTPKEKDMIWDKLNPVYKIRFNFLLYSYMRIVEAMHTANHPEYFRKENRAIFLPIVPGIGKAKCTINRRTIILSDNGINAVEEFFNHKVGFAAYQNMEDAIVLAAKKADFDIKYISTKCLRTTVVSWMMAIFPNQQSQISRCVGHDIYTMNDYYLATGFRPNDKKDMIEELKGLEL